MNNKEKRYQYKRRTHKRRTLQRSDSINVGLTNVGLVQTSDRYKRRTETNVWLVQTSDQYKRRTGTFVRNYVGLWFNFKERPLLYEQIKNHSLIVIKIILWRYTLYKTTDKKEVEFNCHKLWCFNMPIYLQPIHKLIWIKKMPSPLLDLNIVSCLLVHVPRLCEITNFSQKKLRILKRENCGFT